MDAVSSTSLASATAAAAGTSKVMGKDVFLQMLVAQLKNQDPLNPMNGSDFAAQLAQFSSLEQLTNISSQLDTIGANMESLNNKQLAGFLGSEITAAGNTIQADGTSKTLTYSLAQDAQQATVKIYNDQGSLVKTIETGSQKAGLNSVTWNTSGLSGNYTFEVSAVDQKGQSVTAATLITGVVTGVNFKDGVPYLTVNGKEIAFKDVVSVKKVS